MPSLDKQAFAAMCHTCLEEREGRFYATAAGAEKLTGWLRGQGLSTIKVIVDANERYELVSGSAKAGDAIHRCHWPGCPVAVPPALWGCKPHWYRLPWALRARILRAYRPGQEIDKRPSPEYLAVALEVQTWVLEHDKRPHRRRPPV